jgi:hypothetical protein
MRNEPFLTAVPPAPVRTLVELYAIAFDLAQKAARQYGALATQMDQRFQPLRQVFPLRKVFEQLATRERDRCDSLSAACRAACGRLPDASDLHWAPIDLVPAAEIADIRDSSLSTPYTAWALAVRHRQRAFVFWTYVIALAERPLLRLVAEGLAQEALVDGNLLRRGRRRAWRAGKIAVDEAAARSGAEEPASAALLESLLLKDIIAWSQALTPAQRDDVLALDPARLPPPFLMPPGEAGVAPRPQRSNRSGAAPNNCPTSIWTMRTAPPIKAAWNWRRNWPPNPSCAWPACAILPLYPPRRRAPALECSRHCGAEELHGHTAFGGSGRDN